MNVIGMRLIFTIICYEPKVNTRLIHTNNVFANGSSTNIKLSKTELSKMVQVGGFVVDLLEHR